jgi:hypothetical protein
MAETFGRHKTDSQKTWRRRDRKLRSESEWGNFPPVPALLPDLASPVFERLALA